MYVMIGKWETMSIVEYREPLKFCERILSGQQALKYFATDNKNYVKIGPKVV